MMEEDYITYEQADKLKKLGFPQYSDSILHRKNLIDWYSCKVKQDSPVIFTQSLVQKWLREKKNLQLTVRFRGETWFYDIMSGYSCIGVGDNMEKYEQALSGGIDKCIEILENKN